MPYVDHTLVSSLYYYIPPFVVLFLYYIIAEKTERLWRDIYFIGAYMQVDMHHHT